MATLIENVNSILNTKNELANIISDSGQNVPALFSDYPAYIRNSFGDYVTHEELSNASYATTTYVADYVATYAPIPDLSAYVTKTELEGMSYATTTYVADYVAEHGGGGEVIDENIIPKEDNTYNLGSLSYKYNTTYTNNVTSTDALKLRTGNLDRIYISTHIFKPELNDSIDLGTSSYQWASTHTGYLYLNGTNVKELFPSYGYVVDYVATYAPSVDLSAYATKSYVVDYVATYGGGIIDENIIPKENNTYTLGDSSYYYSYIYAQNIVLDNNTGLNKSASSRLDFNLNGDNKFYIGSGGFFPVGSKQLGSNGSKFESTYTKSLYLNGTNIEDRFTYLLWMGSYTQYNNLPDYTTYQLYLIQE